MDYGRIIEEAERRHGLTPGLLASVWKQESNRSTDLNKQGMELSRNRGRARGPFQIVPYYHPEADFGSFESQADYAAKYLADVGLEGYYGTGTPPPGHPTPEQYRDQVMSRVSDPSPPPVGMSPGNFEAMQEPPPMQNNMTTPPQMGGFSLPGTVPLDLSPIEDKFQPSLVDNLVSNPFLMMGLGILGTGNIGEGALKGLGAAAKGQESSRKARQFGIEQERMRRYQQLLENQNRVSEMKLHGAGAASPDALLRQRAAEMTHQRGEVENQIKRDALEQRKREFEHQEGGPGVKKDKDLAKVENAIANLDILETMAFGDEQNPGIFQGRQRGAEGRITSLISDTRQAVTGEDPRHKAYNDFSKGTMASIVKGLGDTGNIAVSEQDRATALLPKLGWDGDTTASARLKTDMLRTLLGNWAARSEAIKNGQEPPPPLTVAEVRAQRLGQIPTAPTAPTAPAPMTAMPPQADPAAGGMLPGGTQALPGAQQAMPPQAGGTRRFFYNPNTGRLEAR